MKTVDIIQGSCEWHAHRSQHFNASDAPAMMGCSPYKTRADLVHERATGIAPEVDAATQRRFDNGHRYEALCLPAAEKMVGDDLYPITGTNGRLSASFDGITLMNDLAFEHKSLNEELRGCMGPSCIGRDLPLHYRVQMEQQCMVSGAEKVLFMASKWDGDSLVEERHCWYTPDRELAAQIRAGWEQFEQDVAAHVPPERTEVVVASPVQALPAVSVIVSGEIAVRDNFKVFEGALRDFLEHRLIREPKTDQDFVDLDTQIKAMKGAEQALDAAESQMLAQIQTVDEAKRTKDMLAKLVRDNRLMAEKLLASEKERRRGEIVAGGVAALREHVAALNKRLGENFLPIVAADFGTAIKGKKSLSGMEDAVATELARAKIAANEIADRIQVNMQVLVDAGDSAHFFDAPTLVLKATDDLRAIVAQRVAEVKRKAEEQRERIRQEETARLQREHAAAAAKAAADASAAVAVADRARDAMKSATAAGVPLSQDLRNAASAVIASVHMDAAIVKATDRCAPITTGALCARLGEGITVTAAFLHGLGFDPAHRPVEAKSGTYWREADFPRICFALANRLQEVAEGVAT